MFIHRGFWCFGVRYVLEAETVVSRAGLCVILCPSQFQSLCQEIESSFYDGMFPWQQLKQHDAASLLKLFIRELPHPLLTVEYLNAFIAVNSMRTTSSWCILLKCKIFTITLCDKWSENFFLCVCVCVHRAPHKEATAAGFEPVSPFVT